MADLCIDPTHHVIKIYLKDFDGGGRLPICSECDKKVDRKDPKWFATCDKCFCSPAAHGKTIYTVCNNCHSCPFYVGVFIEGGKNEYYE